MRRQTVFGALFVAAVAGGFVAALAQERVDYPIDTPLYTMRGLDVPTVSLIQTDIEIEYIGDYLGLDMERAKSALRLLGHVDFAESMLLVVNGGRVEGAMLRVQSVYEEAGVLNVVVDTADPPAQYRDSGFSSPASDELTPAFVTVIPRFEGLLIVHAYPAEWAASGDLRGVQLLVATGGGDASDADESDQSDAD